MRERAKEVKKMGRGRDKGYISLAALTSCSGHAVGGGAGMLGQGFKGLM